MSATSLADPGQPDQARSASLVSSLPEGVQINRIPAQCEKCLAPLEGGKTSICKRCGWYAIAGTFIEIDRAWEDAADPKPAPADSGKLPAWAWVAIVSVCAVVIESAVARGATPDGSRERMLWSGWQFLIGTAAFFACQLVGFVILMRQDATATFLDILLKPFKVSGMLFRDLPRRFWIVNAGISGLAAALCAVAIIGSVPYWVLWTWSIDYRSTQHLEDALAQQTASPGAKIEEAPPKGRKTIACVIIGYELTEAGNIRTVLVARELFGKLRYVGGVTPTGDSALLFELREKLVSAPTGNPIIPMTFDSNWVLPKYTCLISYGVEQENKNLTDIRWEGDVRELRPRD